MLLSRLSSNKRLKDDLRAAGQGVAVSLGVGVCIVGGVGDGLFVSIDTLSSESGKVTNEDAISRVSSSCSIQI